MKVTVIGTGYVGLVTGACLADIGNQVLCCDTDPQKIELLNAGGIPIYEPGLKDVVERNRNEGRLRFSANVADAVAHGDVIMIAVGTPQGEDGSADLQYVLAAARAIGEHMTGFKVIVEKSTVPVGTGDQIAVVLAHSLAARGGIDASFAIVSNPEFLKEGSAVQDFMRPDRIVLGSGDDDAGQKARQTMRQLYAPFNRNHDRMCLMSVRSAEFTKYAANAMLATRISFMNELANLADRVGVDIEMVRLGMGSDPRIGYHFLYAGTGYGGSCFPKDVQALVRTGQEHGQDLQILSAVERVNQAQKQVLVQKILNRFQGEIKGLRFAVWGLAFKPNTDDMREAPSRTLITHLLEAGAHVVAYDPVAMTEARKALTEDLGTVDSTNGILTYADSPLSALDDADALVILTEWKVFKSPDFSRLKALLKKPLIFDGRNLYEPSDMARQGIEYHGVGRSSYAQVPSNFSEYVE